MSVELTNLEYAVLEKMLAGDQLVLKILREQFSKAAISSREMTRTGFFTNLKIPIEVPRVQKTGRVTITDVSANLPELKHEAGFVLFVDNGMINCLEGFCYDESWPGSPDNFELSYLRESPHGSGQLIPSQERDFEFALKDFAP